MTNAEQLTRSLTSHPGCESVKQVGPGCFTFVMRNGRPVPGSAAVEEDWTNLSLQLTQSDEPDYQAALHTNARLAGGARLAIDAAGRWIARAEALTGEEVDNGQRIEQGLEGLHQALNGFGDAAIPDAGQKSCERPADEMAQLLEEAGWTKFSKLEGRYSIRLETVDFHAASLFSTVDGGTLLRTDFEGAQPVSPAASRATSLMLLRAAGAARLVRPAFRGAFGFEANFDTPPEAAELGHALAAMSVVCSFVSREARSVSRDDEVAKAYLEISGG